MLVVRTAENNFFLSIAFLLHHRRVLPHHMTRNRPNPPLSFTTLFHPSAPPLGFTSTLHRFRPVGRILSTNYQHNHHEEKDPPWVLPEERRFFQETGPTVVSGRTAGNSGQPQSVWFWVK